MPGSMELIAAEVRRERDTQLRHFEGLDGKAGVTIGFGGVLVALGANGSVLSIGGRVAAILAALAALWAFFPRRFPVLDLLTLRKLYAGADPQFTQRHLADTHIVMVGVASGLLSRKAFRLKIALGLLGVSVTLSGLAILVS